MRRLWILLLAAALQACGGGGGGGSTTPVANSGNPQACTVADQRQHVLDFMRSEYYWYSQMPAPDANAATLDAYFRSMLYQPTDRFSFSESTAAYEQLFDEGTFTGYGYSLAVVDADNAILRVRTVEPQGPAYAAGLRRGDTIVSINGLTPAQVLAGGAGPVSAEGVQRTIVVRDTAGNQKTLQMVSKTFPLTPVQDVKVVDATRNGQPVKVGYLGYSEFVTYSLADLQNAISAFTQQGATELVLDLRYNGGGDVATSRDLASLVAGARVAGQLFAALRYNDKNQASNSDYRFIAPSASIPSLSRVFVIASGSTASASELVINGLKPFLNVVTVGETTYGKPYGFEPFSYCGTTYNAVNFEVFNAAGVGGYTAGLPPTCPAPDDLDHALGDPNEGRFKVALGYIATGQCAQQAQSAAISSRPQATIGEMPRPGMVRR
ncbi:S41 family peptidase [Ramlibacter sp. PS4R-6]|uniref:S41 family peptidase n=1 Tax=Ramlibacter sp. PS4R-6 TaxID=3133438 RepID=UPI00309DEA9D